MVCFEKISKGVSSHSDSPRLLVGVGRRAYFDVNYPMRIFVCDEVLLCARSDGFKIFLISYSAIF
jgi:hypothetical protein